MYFVVYERKTGKLVDEVNNETEALAYLAHTDDEGTRIYDYQSFDR